MSVMLSAASALDWAARLTGTEDTGALIAKAQARGRLDGREIFLPYLSGERTPHNDPAARGVLFGLDHDSDAAAIGQAVLEGVAFGLADGLDALIEAGARVGQISVIGGGARSPWWGRVLAAALNRPLAYRARADVGPAYGAARLTGSEDTGALVARAQARGRLDGREIFLPYLSGERTPHNDPAARGVLFGLDHDSDAAAIGQAVLEGVAFGLADGLDALIEAGAQVGQISVIGGGARSPWWGRVLAAALNRPLVYRARADVGPAYGAARLARLAVTTEASSQVCAPLPVEALIEPDARDVAVLTPKRHMFEQLYADLRGRFRTIAGSNN